MAKAGKYVKAIALRCWPDYAVLVFLGAFLVILREVVNGNKRHFTPGILEDSGFPYKSADTVPSWTIGTIIWMIPVATIIVAGFLHMLTPLQAHQHVLNFFIMYGLTGVLTNCIKLQIGRPRPSFLARCFPAASDTIFEAVPISSVTQPSCTNEDQGDIDNAYKSFCSGHASYAASSGMYLTLFLMHILQVFSAPAPAAHAVIALVPVSLGIWVGLTRISDYEHHFTDVLCGSLLGMVIATMFFFQAQAIKHETHVLDTDGPLSAVALAQEEARPVGEGVVDRLRVAAR